MPAVISSTSLCMQDRYDVQVRMSKLASLFLIRRIMQYSHHSDHFLIKLDSSLYEVRATTDRDALAARDCLGAHLPACAQLQAYDDAFTGSMKAVYRSVCRHNSSYYSYAELRCPARQHQTAQLALRLAVSTHSHQRPGLP